MSDTAAGRQEKIIEEQAARIRWLLHRSPMDVYWEFTLEYLPDHPFFPEGQDEEPEPGGATSAWEHGYGV